MGWGLNCWGLAGYNIGTAVIGKCLNISSIGTVKVPHKIITPLIYTDNILGNGATQVTIDDNVIITGNLNITGTITASNSNPFYIAAEVAANGTVSTSKGKNGFSSYRASAGVYVITPNTSLGNENYTVNLTCQVGESSGFAALHSNGFASTAFTVIIYVNSIQADAIFHFFRA